MNDDDAMMIVRRLAEIDPTYASETGGDVHCFFCHAWMQHEEHDADCTWLLACQLVAIDDTPDTTT